MKKIIPYFAGLSLVASLAAPVMAQESRNRVAAVTDWSVFVEGNECWSTSVPKDVKNTNSEGKPASVRRGDIMLYVSYRKGSPNGQVSFTGGYPFAGGSTVTLDIGGKTFELFSDGEWAWPESDAEDAKIIAAMKAGSQATLKARSARGTNTLDTFSLLGFTAAQDEAAKRCR